MHYLLFCFYLLIACFFVNRISFIRRAGLGTATVLILFLLKVFAGILLGWMSQKYYPQGNDYWGLNDAGIKEYQFMISDPKAFLADIFHSPYSDKYGGFFDSINSYWNDLKNTLVGKMLAVCNIFTRGNYYSNSLVLNFFGFFGHIALYRVFIDIYKQKKWPVIIGCFLLPSALYFSSGIHRDVLVFMSLGLYCFGIYYYVASSYKVKYFFLTILSFFALFILRNFVAVAVVPATIAFLLNSKYKRKPVPVFVATYIGCFILLAIGYWVTQFNPVEIITKKQNAFFELPFASTQIETKVLNPTFTSLVKNAPQALNHSLLRPYLWEHPTNFLIPLSIELFLYQLLFIVMLVFHKKQDTGQNSFVIFGIFTCISLLLFTGYIVPNLGSIVRYRSLYLPFLITPILCYTNWKKIRNKIIF